LPRVKGEAIFAFDEPWLCTAAAERWALGLPVVALQHSQASSRNARVDAKEASSRTGSARMAQVKVPDRPLSPHLQIYRLSWTMAM